MNPYHHYASGFDLYEEVESSNIDKVGSFGSDLYLYFKPGVWYRYEGAGFLFVSLTSADSIGKLFHQQIKPLYDCYKINIDGSEEKV